MPCQQLLQARGDTLARVSRTSLFERSIKFPTNL
jgi:hypothetical protein